MSRRFQAGAAARLAVLVACATGAGLIGAVPARAQFFWDQPRYSADDAARIAMQHGFRPLAQPARNDNVYVAEVVDQRGRRERLIVSAESGEILQRFYLDDGHRRRRYADPSIPRGPVPPGMIPDEDDRSQVTRLSPDDGYDSRPPAYEPDDQQDRSPPPRRTRRNRTVDQTVTSPRPAPVESAPIAPPTKAPAALRPAPVAPPAPAQASLPSTPPASPITTETKPSRPISHDPLAIPGSREDDQAASRKAKAETAVSATKPTGPVKPAVPVAPLE